MIQYAKRMGAMAYTANVVSNLFGAMTNPDIISFGGGAPAKEALPIDILRQLTDEVIRKDKRGGSAVRPSQRHQGHERGHCQRAAAPQGCEVYH